LTIFRCGEEVAKERFEAPGWKSYWEGLGGAEPFFRAQAQEYVRNLESALVLDSRARVLDFGCGFGFVAEALAPKVGELFVWDSSANMLRCTQRLVAGCRNVRVLDLSDPQTVPCDLRFDLIVVNSVVQYMSLDEFSVSLACWRTLVAPGGRIVISDLIPRNHHAISDVMDMLRFSARRGILGDAILWAFRKLGRYRRVRRVSSFGGIGLEELSQRGKAEGLTVNCLPANLTHFKRRLTVLFTEPGGD
jgi:SAM-dependent methyltransferase